MSLWLVKDNKQYLFDGTLRELPDGIREGYARRAEEALRRKEWKTTGDGAKFTGTYEPTYREQLSINSSIGGFAEYNNAVYFSEQINEIGGIYKKTAPDDRTEAIAVSSNDRYYGGLDIFEGKLAVSVMLMNEAHIAFCRLPSFDLTQVTEGNSVDADPVWSKHEPEVLYFSSAGLPEGSTASEPVSPFMTPANIVDLMQLRASPLKKGPSSICRLDINSGELTTVLEDDCFDFIKPFSSPDGSLYYIKRPYSTGNETNRGCLSDILLLPVRLVRSLFGFLSFFSLKYLGSPLSSGGSRAKQKDDRQLFIDGNLIDAEAELRANRSDPLPGIIPKSWELRRITANNTDELVFKGVLCYTVDEKGRVILSNGKHLILLENGDVKRLADADGVTLIKACL